MMTRLLTSAALALSLLALSGCDESDAASVRVRLDAVPRDAAPKGQIAISTLSAPAAPTAAEQLTSGAGLSWSGRAAVILSRGQFDDLTKLNIGEVTFNLLRTPTQSILEVNLPRGAGVKWPGLLAVGDTGEMGKARAVMLPDDPDSKLGKIVKIVVEAPAKVTGTDSSVAARGLSASSDQKEATLVVPIAEALKEGDPIRWTIKWDTAK